MALWATGRVMVRSNGSRTVVNQRLVVSRGGAATFALLPYDMGTLGFEVKEAAELAARFTSNAQI